MKNLFNRSLPLLILITAAATLRAQDDDLAAPSPARLKEIKAQKSAYITSQLELTTEEAQLFWPIYNEFDAKQEQIRKDLRDLLKGAHGGTDGLTEAEAAQLLDKGLQSRQKEIDLEKSYQERFRKSIGSVKTLKLREAERNFNREVLKRFRERMEERRGGADPRRPARR